jgi:ERF superfamily
MNAVVADFEPSKQPGTLLAVIERAAADPAVDVEKMERLMAMYERVQAKNAEAEFTRAMISCQSEIKRIAANRENPQTRSMYATYDTLDRIIRPIYTQAGFALSFDTGESPSDMVKVLCHVMHREGHTRTYHTDIPADGKGAKGGDVMTKTHAMGSGMTYGRRYLLALIFNLAFGKDDDGNGATAGEYDAIYDKIDLAQSLEELKKVYPEVDGAAGAGKRNLIAAYNKRVRTLKGLA